MEFDSKVIQREKMAAKLNDAIEHLHMHSRFTTNPMNQLMRLLCETTLWLIRDWPGQKVDNLDSVRTSRDKTAIKLRQLLRTEPPQYSELDTLILFLSEAMLTISEQWPGGESEPPANPVDATQQQKQLLLHHAQNSQPTVASSTTVTSPTVSSLIQIPLVYGGPGTLYQPPAPKLPRLAVTAPISQSSAPSVFLGAEPPKIEEVNMEKAATRASTTVLNDESTLSDMSNIPLFSNEFVKEEVKEEEVDLDETLDQSLTSANDNNDEPSNTQSPNSALIPRRYSSPVWQYFTAKELNEEKIGFCHLCKWSRKIPDCRTDNLWCHLRSNHPVECAILEPLRIKRTSNVWQYFTKTEVNGENLGFCNLCDWVDKKRADNMWTHLRVTHPLQYSIIKPHEKNRVKTPANVSRAEGGCFSDIWQYFTKRDVDGENHGFCDLCTWHKTSNGNAMWSHLRNTHPREYLILKPYESYRVPAVHGPLALVSGAVVPSHRTLPRPQSTVSEQPAGGGELPKEKKNDGEE